MDALTHLQGLAEIAVRLKHTDHLLAVGQRHPAARVEDDIQNRPKGLQNLAIHDSAATRVQVGVPPEAFKHMAIDMPDPNTTHNLNKLWPGNIWTAVEALAQMNAVPTPDIVQELDPVRDHDVRVLLENLVESDVCGGLPVCGVSLGSGPRCGRPRACARE